MTIARHLFIVLVAPIVVLPLLAGEPGAREPAGSRGHGAARPGRGTRGVGRLPAPCSLPASDDWRPVRVDLAPARWIWLPSQRTLPNTFVLFRRTLHLDRAPRQAKAWITADSRYRLTVNGHRVQWGPAPCDPRQLDVDPADLLPLLHAGDNVIGVEVLFYGAGDGTWAAGKPGLLFHADLEMDDGSRQTIVSDQSWQARLDRAHRPGQPKSLVPACLARGIRCPKASLRMGPSGNEAG